MQADVDMATSGVSMQPRPIEATIRMKTAAALQMLSDMPCLIDTNDMQNERGTICGRRERNGKEMGGMDE